MMYTFSEVLELRDIPVGVHSFFSNIKAFVMQQNRSEGW